MTEQDDTSRVVPNDADADRAPPNPAAEEAVPTLTPTVWVTALIVLVLLLLAVFGLG
jgi:hypothetical protein